jgi:opacity protein-like surface antigen
MRTYLATVGVGVVLLCVSLAQPASAEWTADLYLGGAFTQAANLINTNDVGFTATFHDINIDFSITGGVRLGYWFEGLEWLGVAVDTFYFQPKGRSQSAFVTVPGLGSLTTDNSFFSYQVLGIGIDLVRLRFPLLRDESFPKGRVQPYLSGGPSLFMTWIDTSGAQNLEPVDQTDSDTSLGVKVGAGLSFLLTPSIALFGEYRFTHFTTRFMFRDTSPLPSRDTFRITFDTHHFIGGVSFQF